MASVNGTATATGVLTVLQLGKKGDIVTVALSGTYVATTELQRAASPDETMWEKVAPSDVWKTDNATVSFSYVTRHDNERLRLFVSAYTSGNLVWTLSDAAKIIQRFVDDDGNELFQLTEDGIIMRGTLTVDGAMTATGGVTGALTGDASGTAATVTGGTQASITVIANCVEVGALAAGTIASGFGTISTGNAITTTAVVTGGSFTPTDNIGTKGAGATSVVHVGDGVTVTAILTLTNIAVTVGSGAPENLEIGLLVYTLPAGNITINALYLEADLSGITQTGETPDMGMGTVLAASATATLAGTDEDIVTAAAMADSNGTSYIIDSQPNLNILTSAGLAHTVHLNFADAWGTNGDADGVINGVIRLTYTFNAA